MESLALVVVFILAIVLFSGPTALFLTWLPALNRDGTNKMIKFARRIVVTLLALFGSLMSFNLMIVGSTMAAGLIGLFGTVFSIIAMQREYFPDGFRTIIGKEGKNKNGRGFFGNGSDRRNGPSGQH